MPSTLKSKVYFFFDEVAIFLPYRSDLKKFIGSIFKKEKKKLKNINYIFCSDKRILQINSNYLKHYYYTDIITFDLSEQDLGIVGEIYISIDRVKENAEKFGTTFKSEIHRVIFHGALHLCGYTDKGGSEKIIMRNKENSLLLAYFSL